MEGAYVGSENADDDWREHAWDGGDCVRYTEQDPGVPETNDLHHMIIFITSIPNRILSVRLQ